MSICSPWKPPLVTCPVAPTPRGNLCSDPHYRQVVLLALDLAKWTCHINTLRLTSFTRDCAFAIHLCGHLWCGSSYPVVVWYSTVRACPSSLTWSSADGRLRCFHFDCCESHTLGIVVYWGHVPSFLLGVHRQEWNYGWSPVFICLLVEQHLLSMHYPWGQP